MVLAMIGNTWLWWAGEGSAPCDMTPIRYWIDRVLACAFHVRSGAVPMGCAPTAGRFANLVAIRCRWESSGASGCASGATSAACRLSSATANASSCRDPQVSYPGWRMLVCFGASLRRHVLSTTLTSPRWRSHARLV